MIVNRQSSIVSKQLTSYVSRFAAIFLISSFSILHAQAQVKISASVDKREIRIGEQLKLNLEAVYPQSTPVTWFDVPDTFNTLEVVDRKKIDSTILNNAVSLKQEFTITGFDSGRWAIPSFIIVSDGRNYVTDSFSIIVDPVALEGTDYKEIKDVVDPAKQPVDKTWWWIIGGAVLLLALVVWWLTRKKKKPLANDLKVAGAYEQALKQLEVLKKESLIEKGEIVLYYTKLSEIFRTYLLRDKGIRSMEKTSLEILAELKKILPPADLTGISVALRRSDFVKFAKYTPPNNEHVESMQTIEQTIKQLHHQK